MSLFDERVDAAVAEYDRHFSSRTQTVFGAGMRRTAMAEAIRAADAVVTEEMIAKEIGSATVSYNLSDLPDQEGCGCYDINPLNRFIAKRVLALFRGGAK